MLLGIDVGTSAVKVAVFDPEGSAELPLRTPVHGASAPLRGRQVLSAQSEETLVDSPRPGFAEQHPDLWWEAALQALDKIPAEIKAQIQAIGISYQMHGLIVVDDRGAPLRPAIIWCDGRATAMGDRIAQAIQRDTGVPPVSNMGVSPMPAEDAVLNHPGNFTAAKLRWVAENEPEIFRQVRYAMLPGDYLAMRLTGQPATTASGLSEMIAWNFVERRPSHEIWQAALADTATIPPLAPTFGEQGRITAEIAQRTGIPKGTPVTYRAGDQPNNALSLNVFHPGELAAVAGTSGVLYGITDQPTIDPLQRVNTFLHVNDTPEKPRLGVLLCINGAGSFYSWTRRALNCASFEELNALAAEAPPGANGVVAIPFGNGPERVLGNTNPGASFQNLDLNRHTRADVARAALESVAFAMRYGANALREMGLRTDVVKAGDASMFRSELFRQVFANVLGVELQILDTDGALGAARAAGVGSGHYANLEEAFSGLTRAETRVPDFNYDAHFGSWSAVLASERARYSSQTRQSPSP